MLPKGHGLQHMVVVRMDIVVVVTGDAGGRDRRECQRSFSNCSGTDKRHRRTSHRWHILCRLRCDAVGSTERHDSWQRCEAGHCRRCGGNNGERRAASVGFSPHLGLLVGKNKLNDQNFLKRILDGSFAG